MWSLWYSDADGFECEQPAELHTYPETQERDSPAMPLRLAREVRPAPEWLRHVTDDVDEDEHVPPSILTSLLPSPAVDICDLGEKPRSPGAWPCSGGFPLLGCRSAAPQEPLDLDADEDPETDADSTYEWEWSDAEEGENFQDTEDHDDAHGMAMDLCGIISDLDINLADTINPERPFDITVDSGAGKSVMPLDAAPDYELQKSPGQVEGQHFVGAGGERLRNMGQKIVPLQVLGDETQRCATFQVAPVRKPLMAVSASCDAGHLCLFDNDGSFLIQRDSAEGREIRRLAKRCIEKMALERRNGVYVLPTTIVAPEQLTPQARSRTQPKSAWKSTAMEVDAVFHRQGR